MANKTIPAIQIKDTNVGIGTTDPAVKLSVSGVTSTGDRKLSLGVLDINVDNASQIRINTKIPLNSGSADFTVNIKGFRYGAPQMVSLSIGWHYYLGSFYNETAISNGAWSPTITLAQDANGFVVIYLPTPGYWAKLYVESLYTSSYGDVYSSGWTWTDANLSDCTNLEVVPYNALVTNITGNAVNLSTNRTDWGTNGTISAVVGQLGWKAYGNSHTIFDASAASAPNGSGISNTNAQIPWSSTYPNLMGWDGVNTYGLRVDSARVADSTSAVSGTTNYVSKFTSGNTIGNSLLYDNGTSVGIGTTLPAYKLHVKSTTAGTTAAFTGDQGFDGSNRVFITNDAYIYGRNNLVLTGRLDASNDGFGFGTTCRNAIVFNTNSGGAQGDVGTEYYSVQLEGNTSSLYFQSYGSFAAGREGIVFTQDSRIGIGTTSPSEKLEVNGNVQIGTSVDAKLYMVSSGGNGYNERFFIEGYADGGTYGGGFKLYTRNDSNVFNTAVTVNRNGYVGIGTTNPTSQLHVYTNNDIWHTTIGGASGELRIGGQHGGGAVIQSTTPGGTARDLYLQRDGGYIGVGTANPGAKLDIDGGDLYVRTGGRVVTNTIAPYTGDLTINLGGSGNNLIVSGGNVGIGTTSPDNGKLTILKNSSYATENSYGISIQSNTSNAYTELLIGADDTVDCGVIQTAGKNTSFTTKKLSLQPNGGKVGIGTTNPDQTLSVAGNAIIGQGLNRPVTYDSNGGNFRIKANAGGWSMGYFFDGSAGTYKGGFGGFGDADTLYYYWIGDDYNTPTMVIRPNQGNVGIGTTNPDAYPFSAKLSVAGNISVSGTKIGWGVTDAFTLNGIDTAHYGLSSNFNLVQLSGYGGVVFATTGTERMRITGAGYVGIGTDIPSEKLTVSGKIYANPNLPVVISGQGIPYYGTNITLASDTGTTQGANRIWSRYDATGSGAITFERSTSVQAYNSDPQLLSYTESMRIAGNGNVGIGTDIPSSKLDVRGTSGTSLRISSSDNYHIGSLSWEDGLINLSAAGYGSPDLRFLTGGSEKMRITNSGNVGIGQSSPQSLLHLKQGTSSFFRMSRGAVANYGFELGVSNDFYLYDYNNSRSALTILNSGNIGIGTTNPTKVLSLKRASICGIELDDNTSVTDITSIGGRFTIDTPSQAYVNISSNNQFYVDGTSVGVHTAAPDPSAALDVTSTTQGFLPPRMTDAEMNSIGGPAAGLIVWNTDTQTLFVYDGSNWRKIAYA